MSAIPHMQERVIVDRRPMPRVSPQPRARAKVRVRTRTRSWTEVARFGMWVGMGLFTLHFVGGFSLQLMIEQSRRAVAQSERRALQAEQEAASLRLSIDKLEGADRVGSWAALNGFKPSYLAANDSQAH